MRGGEVPLSRDFPVPDERRLRADLEALAALTRPDRPWTRRAFSEEDRAARRWLTDRMAEAGLIPRVDAAANVIGSCPGREACPPLVIGSHLDTVEEGGRFDGIAGVLAGLEVARCLHAAGHRLRHPLEVVDFTAEEPTEFGLSTVGSRAMTGRLDGAMARRLREPSGRTLAEAVDALGGQGAAVERAARAPGSLAAYLELHIEQGPRLEQAGVPLGVVTLIAAPSRLQVVVRGRADHAGGTPMGARRDALAAAAELVLLVERIAEATGQGTVGTVGRLEVRPNMVNVVPGEVRLAVDVRGTDEAAVSRALEAFAIGAGQVAGRRGVTLEATPVVREQPVRLPETLVAQAEAAARATGVPCLRLQSGASHDASHLARIAPTALLFIPCREGRSHCPEEWAEPGHLAAGTRVLLELLLQLDARR